MPLQTPMPLENAETINATRHIRSPHPHETYHAGQHSHVATPYDKRSKLYHPDLFNWHDLYNPQMSYSGSIVTRSQTAFNRIEIGDSEMKLFEDRKRHHPPDLPHLVMTMKDGTYGALPRTIVTRSMAEELETNPTLTKTIEAYKSFKPMEALTQLEKKRKPSILDRFLNKKDSVDVMVNVKNEGKGQEDGMLKYLPFHDLKEASPSNNGPVRHIDQPKHYDNISSVGVKPPLLRESKFSQEVLDNLSHVNAPFSSTGFSKILKEPSFTVTQNPFAVTIANSNGVESQSRGENQEHHVPLHSVSSGGLIGSPSPNPGVFQQNQMKSRPQSKPTPSGMYS